MVDIPCSAEKTVLAGLLILALIGGIYASGVAPGGGSTEEGLVAEYRFDTAAGDTAYDTAGNNDGTINGATWTKGVEGKALNFDGDDYVESGVEVDQTSGFGGFTMSAWVYPTADDARRHVLSTDNGGCDWSIHLDGDGYWNAFTGDSCGVDFQPVELNQWQHVAIIYTENDVKFCKNGNCISRGTGPGFDSSTEDLRIGDNPDYNENWKGRIDRAKVYRTALNESQIKSLYNSGSWRIGTTTEEDDPSKVLDVSFQHQNSSHVLDTSGYNNHGKKVNGVPQRNAVECITGRCYSFDGSDDYVDVGSEVWSEAAKNDEITIMYWASKDDLNDYEVALGGKSGDSLWTEPWRNSNNGVSFRLTDTGGTGHTFESSYFIEQDKWYHFSYVYNGSAGKIYVDGRKVLDQWESFDFAAPGAGYIGSYNGGGNVFDGKIDQVRVYNRSLSREEVWKLYTRGRDRETGMAGPVGWWRMDGEPEHQFIAYQADDTDLNYQYSYQNGTFGPMESFGDSYSDSNTDGGIAVADVTGDGVYDIIHANEGNPDGGKNVYLWKNVREEPPSNPELIATVTSGDGNFQGTTTGDFDNDGDVDIITVSGCCGNSPTWLIENTDSGWSASELGSSFAARDIASADFNEDGCEDLIHGSSGDVSYRPGHCDGTFGSATVVSNLGDDNYLATADFDEDGHMDFAVNPQSNGSIHLYTGNGDGTFDYRRKIYETNDHIGLVAADMNKDGYQDLVGCLHSGHDAFFIPGHGDGTFGSYRNLGSTGGNCIGAAAPNERHSLEIAENNNGLLRGNPVWKSGKIGRALKFDGNDDFVEIHDNSDTSLDTDLSVGAWAKLESGGAPDTIIQKDSNYGVLVDSGSKIFLEVWDESGNRHKFYLDDISGYYGEWGHFMYTVDENNRVALYINGDLKKTWSISFGVADASNNPVLLGKRNSNTYFTDGKIDDVRIYPYALSQEQVKQVMNSGSVSMG